jgi:hypothetical protein
MNAETLVKLVEEMVDIKIQQHAEADIKAGPELAQLLQEKKITDRRRLDQIRAEIVRVLGS